MFFVELLVRGVDHHRAVEPAGDAVVAGLFRAVVEMDGENRLGKDLVGRADHGLQEPLVGVAAGAAGDLNDERGAVAGLTGSLLDFDLPRLPRNRPTRLLEVVDVVGPHGVPAVGGRKSAWW